MGLYFNIASFFILISLYIILAIFLKKLRKEIFVGIIIFIIFFLHTSFLENKYNNCFSSFENANNTNTNIDNTDSNKNIIEKNSKLSNNAEDFSKMQKLRAKVISNKESGDYYDKYVVKIKSGKDRNIKILLYLKKSNFEYGDIIEFTGKIEKPDGAYNEGGFDYSEYLKQKKIYRICTAEKFEKIGKEKDFAYFLYKIKALGISKIEKLYFREEAGFLKAILFGETGNLEDEIKENFRKSNLSHILAISGLHITCIVLFVEKFLKIFLKKTKLINYIIIIFLILFSFLVGGSTSVVRACIMNIIAYLAKIFLQKEDFYTSFELALFITLSINVYNINSAGMWLSYGGTIGIVLFSKFINKILKRAVSRVTAKIEIKNKTYKFLKNMINQILEIISVSMSAQTMIFPIMLYYFNTLSLSFLISNILISSIVSPIIILGYFSIIVFPISNLISYIEKILLFITFKIVSFCSKIPFNEILLPTPKIIHLLIFYVFIFIFVKKVSENRFKFFRIILAKKEKNHFNFFKIIKICTKKTIILLVIAIIINSIFQKPLRINFINVGQGDCTLVRTAENKVILIDGGEGKEAKYDFGEKVVVPYLLDLGITKIDYLIISHFDTDHCGGTFYILENMKVGKVILGKQAEEYENCVDFVNLAKKKNVKIETLKRRDKYALGKLTYLEVLFPDTNNTISENKINNNSFVFKLIYKNFSMLFTGDIEEEAEEYLVKEYGKNLNATILKVAHHGSKTSSTQEFIENVKPKIALIGVGKDNKFGHPNEQVIERLKKLGSKVFRTDINKDIKIIYKDGKISIQ